LFFVLIEKRRRKEVIKILSGLFQSESSCQNHTQPEGKKTVLQLSFLLIPFSIQSGADAYYFYHSGDPNTSPTTIINLLYSKSNLVLLV
jgi:hypothetical protein